MGKYKYEDYKEICIQNNISRDCFYQRTNVLGWDTDRAISSPVRRRSPQKTALKNKPSIALKNTKAPEAESTFIPISNFPAKEYLRWLDYRIKELESMSFKKESWPCLQKYMDILNMYKEEKRVLDTYFYTATDLYVTAPETAKAMYSSQIINSLRISLKVAKKDENSIIYKVYYTFSEKYGLDTIITKKDIRV